MDQALAVFQQIEDENSMGVRAIGFNVAIEVPSASNEPVASDIASALIRTDFLSEHGIQISGAGAKFWYNADDGLHFITIEPASNQPAATRLFVNHNIHRDESTLPSAELGADLLQACYDDLLRLLSELF